MLVAGARAQDAGAAVHAAAATSRATTNLDRWEHAFQARAELSAIAAAEGSQPRVSTDVPQTMSLPDDASAHASAHGGHRSGSSSLADDLALAAHSVAAAAAAEAEKAAKHATDLAAVVAAKRAKAAKRAADPAVATEAKKARRQRKMPALSLPSRRQRRR